MAEFTSVTLSAWGERGTTTVSVDATGEQANADDLTLQEVPPSSQCYVDGNVLCVRVVKNKVGAGGTRWTARATFSRSAEYVVLVYGADNRVLTAKRVEKG